MKSAGNKSSDISGAQSPIMSQNQENTKPKDRGEERGDFISDFAFAYTCKRFGRFVSADEVFHGGRIKVHKDSDPLIPKAKKENSSKHRNQVKGNNSKTPVNIQGMNSKETSESKSWSSNWKLKDWLLFRNGSNKEYEIVGKSRENLCLELGDSHLINVKSGGERRRKEGVSAHERHYKKNRAAAEEMRRKTFLPYKKTLMGCSDLDPGVHEFCKGHARS